MIIENAIDVGSTVIFSHILKYGSIAIKYKLSELVPQKGKVICVDIHKGTGREHISYTVECNGCIYEKIHTVFCNEEDYYSYIAKQIMFGSETMTKINVLEKIKDAVKYFFTK